MGGAEQAVERAGAGWGGPGDHAGGVYPAAPAASTAACRRAWRLTRTLAEGTAALLAACWQNHPSSVRPIFVPLASAALERPEAVPVLGRMIALAGADEDLARIVMPLRSDALASQTSGADAEVRWAAGAGAARALACRQDGCLQAGAMHCVSLHQLACACA